MAPQATSQSGSSTIADVSQHDVFSKAQNFIEGNVLTISNFVSNEFVTQTSDEWIDSFEPKTGKLYARVQNSCVSEVETAIDAACTAFKTWSRTSRAERSSYLQRIAALIKENRELFAVWESIDQGKTLERARVEVDRAISNFSYVFSNVLSLSHENFIDR